MSKKEKQQELGKEEKELQNSTASEETETVELSWTYFFKTITLVLRLYQVVLMRRHHLLTSEQALWEIESQLDDWVKMP